MAPALIEVGDGWELPVQGWQVTRCFVDPGAFGLLVDGGTGETLHLYLEGLFTASESDALVSYGGGDAVPSDYAPLLALMGRTVARVYIARSGDLHIEFDDASTIHVPPDPDYEAWELDGLGRLMVICMPGGGEPAIVDG